MKKLLLIVLAGVFSARANCLVECRKSAGCYSNGRAFSIKDQSAVQSLPVPSKTSNSLPIEHVNAGELVAQRGDKFLAAPDTIKRCEYHTGADKKVRSDCKRDQESCEEVQNFWTDK